MYDISRLLCLSGTNWNNIEEMFFSSSGEKDAFCSLIKQITVLFAKESLFKNCLFNIQLPLNCGYVLVVVTFFSQMKVTCA